MLSDVVLFLGLSSQSAQITVGIKAGGVSNPIQGLLQQKWIVLLEQKLPEAECRRETFANGKGKKNIYTESASGQWRLM